MFCFNTDKRNKHMYSKTCVNAILYCEKHLIFSKKFWGAMSVTLYQKKSQQQVTTEYAVIYLLKGTLVHSSQTLGSYFITKCNYELLLALAFSLTPPATPQLIIWLQYFFNPCRKILSLKEGQSTIQLMSGISQADRLTLQLEATFQHQASNSCSPIKQHSVHPLCQCVPQHLLEKHSSNWVLWCHLKTV